MFDDILNLIAQALYEADDNVQEEGYDPGIGPCREVLQVTAVSDYLISNNYESEREVQYPNNHRYRADLLIDNSLVVEAKLLRPLGNNGQPNGANWYSKILYPFENVNSSYNDVRKLIESGFNCDKAIILLAHFNEDSRNMVESTVENYNDLISRDFPNIDFDFQSSIEFDDLVHPEMNILKIYGWKFN